MVSIKNPDDKTARGYRLRDSTHKMISELEELMKTNQDVVLTEACRILYRKVMKKVKKQNEENLTKENQQSK